MSASSDQDFVQEQILHFINSELGSDISNLKKCRNLYRQLVDTKTSLENKVYFVGSEVPGRVQTVVHEAQEIISHISDMAQQQDTLKEEIRDHLMKVEPAIHELETTDSHVKELEKYSSYLECIAQIDDTNSDIQTSILVDSLDSACDKFIQLAEITKDLQSSDCINLKQFAQDSLQFWYKLLHGNLSRDFDELLQSFCWPFITSTVDVPTVQKPEVLQSKLEDLFEQLLKLQLPDDVTPDPPTLTDNPSWKRQLLPMELLLKPLQKRFRFHFYGAKQTNKLEKPEWYLTQVLGWIRDHAPFLNTKIQPLVQKAGLKHVNVQTEFTRGLLFLVTEKMIYDTPELSSDDHLFSHFVDEVLSFHKDLCSSYGYPSTEQGCLNFLTRDEVFEKWIYVERKFALEKMDEMLLSGSAWASQYKDIDEVDDMKIPECAESFMTLLLTITERYKPLPDHVCQIKFLELQLELFEDYRIRLNQVYKQETNPLHASHCAILNAAHYIEEVLKEWSELLFFLQLQYFRKEYQTMNASSLNVSERDRSLISESLNQLSLTLDESVLDSVDGSVFEELIQYMTHLKSEMVTAIVKEVTLDVKARSKPYRKDRWLALPSLREVSSQSLSVSACEMILALKGHLSHVRRLLNSQLFRKFWQLVAADLDTFLYNDVILANHFNEGGASQLNFDMTRNLFPLFGEFTSKPENYFKDVKEACLLLTANIGTGKILKDILYRALHTTDAETSHEDPVAALLDVGVYKLSLEEAELVLSLRTDLKMQ